MKLLKKVMALVIVLVAGAWAYHANSGRASMDMNTRVASGNTPFPVVLASVERQTIRGTATYAGSVVPYNEEEIYPRVTGRILEMSVYPGDRVEKGQVVARLDDVELTSKVREAEAMLATAQANRTQMEAELSAARYGIAQMQKELAMAEAETGFQQTVAARDERLFAKGAISQQDAESSRSMAVSATAKVEAARAKVEQMRAMEASDRKKLEAMDAMVALGQAQLRTAQVVRGYVDIQAPSTGYVVKRLVAPGVLVQPGMAILKTTQVDRVRLQANVGEKDLASIKPGSPVTVATTSSDASPITARVTSVFPYVDPGARTAVVEALVDNPGRRLVAGQYVQMQFTTGEQKDALTVPSSAVARLGGKATVWTLKGEDRVEPREVLTGLEGPDRVEIAKGLTGGEGGPGHRHVHHDGGGPRGEHRAGEGIRPGDGNEGHAGSWGASEDGSGRRSRGICGEAADCADKQPGNPVVGKRQAAL
ncbi:MAG: efflux RND transporter periplasmic adaptor subunit [candidate division NC10 bacterium]|nr:efflux RND transporter periplasmic adaptor subunit [candidate division NC10 bacterium]